MLCKPQATSCAARDRCGQATRHELCCTQLWHEQAASCSGNKQATGFAAHMGISKPKAMLHTWECAIQKLC